MKLSKRIGGILFCLLPVLLAFGIQLVVSIAGIFLKIFMEIFSNWELFTDSSADTNAIIDSTVNSVMSSIMDSQFLAGISAVYAVIAALILGFWYWKRFCPKKQPRREVSSIINPTMVGGLVFLMLGMQYICNYIILLLATINPSWYKTYEDLLKSVGFGDVTPLLALYSVIIAPISEELIFRGVTMKYAAKVLPFVAANILQAFLFGLFHANIIQGTYAFIVGLFCGYVCYKGGSLYLSILFHMLFNIWGTFAPQSLSYSGNFIPFHILIFVAATCVAFIGVFLYRKGIAQRPPMRNAVSDSQNQQSTL